MTDRRFQSGLPLKLADATAERVRINHDARIAELAKAHQGGSAKWSTGAGSPNGAVTGNVGDLFSRTDGGAGTSLYVKESGHATNTGWVGK